MKTVDPLPHTLYLFTACLLSSTNLQLILSCEGNPPPPTPPLINSCLWRSNHRCSSICSSASSRRKMASITQLAGRQGICFQFIPLCVHVARSLTLPFTFQNILWYISHMDMIHNICMVHNITWIYYSKMLLGISGPVHR